MNTPVPSPSPVNHLFPVCEQPSHQVQGKRWRMAGTFTVHRDFPTPKVASHQGTMVVLCTRFNTEDGSPCRRWEARLVLSVLPTTTVLQQCWTPSCLGNQLWAFHWPISQSLSQGSICTLMGGLDFSWGNFILLALFIVIFSEVFNQVLPSFPVIGLIFVLREVSVQYVLWVFFLNGKFVMKIFIPWAASLDQYF